MPPSTVSSSSDIGLWQYLQLLMIAKNGNGIRGNWFGRTILLAIRTANLAAVQHDAA